HRRRAARRGLRRAGHVPGRDRPRRRERGRAPGARRHPAPAPDSALRPRGRAGAAPRGRGARGLPRERGAAAGARGAAGATPPGPGRAPRPVTRPTARRLAIDALVRVDDGAWANLVVPALLDGSGLEERDRAFVTELVYGTTRMRRACDWLVSRSLDRPLGRL